MYNHQLDAFVAATEFGGFGKAAQAMYISTPALIQQVNLLEARCGFRLFERSNRGVRLTAAGRSLYEDARAIIRLSHNALEKGTRLAEASQTTVRVGTSLLFKCRLLPDIWAKISRDCPDLRIEILSMPEHQGREASVADLGGRYDVCEGVYASLAQAGTCGFLELMRTPLCCAVARGHRLAHARRLSVADLNGEYLVMPIAGVSAELDAFRAEIAKRLPTAHIVDSGYYGEDTFTLCEVNPYVLVTQRVYSDIHANLVTIPLDAGISLPYGLMYANDPTPAARRFVETARRIAGTTDYRFGAPPSPGDPPAP